jgi:hypothetical protein
VLLALLRTDQAQAQSWGLRGRAGVEFDGLSERFGGTSLFDTRLAPTLGAAGDPQPVDDAALSLRFRDRSTRASALVDLNLNRPGDGWFRSRALIRASRLRTRGEVDLSAGSKIDRGDVTVGDRLNFQGGPQGFGGGAVNQLHATWRRRDLPAGLELHLRTVLENSRAGSDSLRSLFNYRIIRPAADLGRTLGPAGDITLRGGLGRKTTPDRSVGAYTEEWGEVEWTRWADLDRSWSVRLRSETRDYGQADSLTPSYEEGSLEGELELSGPWKLRTRLQPSTRRVRYAADSEVFQDHWAAEGTLRLEAGWRDLVGKRNGSGVADPSNWSFSLGGKGGLLRNRSHRESDYHALSVLTGVSRDASKRFWLDWTAELGRRSYRVSGGSRGLVFEGLNISLSGTDYAFISSTLLAELRFWPALSVEVFGMVDQEIHSSSQDDFSLASFTLSLTRTF